MKEENLPRSLWKLSKIIETSKNIENTIRSVTIETATKRKLKHPINMLYALEIPSMTNNEENQNEQGVNTITIPTSKGNYDNFVNNKLVSSK